MIKLRLRVGNSAQSLMQTIAEFAEDLDVSIDHGCITFSLGTDDSTDIVFDCDAKRVNKFTKEVLFDLEPEVHHGTIGIRKEEPEPEPEEQWEPPATDMRIPEPIEKTIEQKIHIEPDIDDFSMDEEEDHREPEPEPEDDEDDSEPPVIEPVEAEGEESEPIDYTKLTTDEIFSLMRGERKQ